MFNLNFSVTFNILLPPSDIYDSQTKKRAQLCVAPAMGYIIYFDKGVAVITMRANLTVPDSVLEYVPEVNAHVSSSQLVPIPVENSVSFMDIVLD